MKRRLLLALIQMAPLFMGLIIPPAPALAGGASFYASPGGGALTVGQTIQVTIYVNSGGQPINAGEGNVTWTAGLQYAGVSAAGSVFNTWTSGGGAGPSGSGSGVYFSGGLANPGYNGGGGKIATISLKVTTPGTQNVNVSGSQILANDGLGTNVYCCSSGASYGVAAPKPPAPRLSISSSSHPNEGQWYTGHNFQVSWSSGGGTTYSYNIDHSSGGSPGSPNNGTTSTSQQLDDGVWYFHLKGTSANGTTTGSFAVHIDSQPPGGFQTTIDDGGNNSNPTPKVNFASGDATSGIDHYSATIDGGAAFGINPGDVLPKLHPGPHAIVVTAFDKAGNGTSSTAKFNIVGIAPPKIVSSPTFLVILQPMHYVGQSEPGDTISVYLNDKVIETFVARDRKASKAKDKGSGGFPAGITWEYTYKPQLFPATYHIHFARVNNVGAESEPTKDLPLQIAATPKTKAATATWFTRNVSIALFGFIALQLLVEFGLGVSLQYRTWMLNNALHHKVVKPLMVKIITGFVAWRPFAWISGGPAGQRGWLFLGTIKWGRGRKGDKRREL